MRKKKNPRITVTLIALAIFFSGIGYIFSLSYTFDYLVEQKEYHQFQ